MSDNQMIRFIHYDTECDRLWRRATDEQKREILRRAAGETKNLAEIMRGVMRTR